MICKDAPPTKGERYEALDMSGFGGSYEATCQKMLLNGRRYLVSHPDFDFDGFQEYQNLYGVFESDSKIKALQKALTQGIPPALGTTVAQHQATIARLRYIHEKGYKTMLQKAGEKLQRYWTSEAEIMGVLASAVYDRRAE